MIEKIKLVFTWSGLNTQVKGLVRTSHKCQICKQVGKKKYGLLSPKTVESIQWNRVNFDLWGPKSVVNVNSFTYELHVMTMVDPLIDWFEQRQLYGPPNTYVYQQIPDSVWLSRYPRPKEIGYDNGSEFKMEFQDLCANMGLKQCPSNA